MTQGYQGELSPEIREILGRASDDELRQVREIIQGLLNGLRESSDDAFAQHELHDVPDGTSAPSGETTGPGCGSNEPGWIEVKTINGHEYAYRRWYEGGVKRSKYLGRADKVLGHV